MSADLATFDRLGVRFGAVEAVRDLSFVVAPGETAAIVGETGSGKSVAMLAALGLLPKNAQVSGSVKLQGQELIGFDRRRLDAIRGKAVTIVFQEPQSALDPLFTVGAQIAAVLRNGRGLARRAAWARAIDLLDEVGIPEPARRAKTYPHELSGGQRQRVAIAMAIACEPRLLIADEPTTALDVTVAARILALLTELKARHDMALILISHDLGMVRRVADHVHVMEAGRLVESGTTADIVARPREAYTRKLLAADSPPPCGEGQGVGVPVSFSVAGGARLDPHPRPLPARGRGVYAEPILQAEHLTVRYPLRGGWFGPKRWFTAVDHASLAVPQGETLGLIGESGSGKSTLGRALVKLEASAGAIRFMGRDLQSLSEAAMRPLRRELQIVFQDPFASLSPRWRVGEIIGEGLAIHEPGLAAETRAARVAAALEDVGLPAAFAARLPHELSGGQRQRVAIARAIILAPRVVVLDEPTSALDRSVQADVLALLRRLQAERGLSYLFITHDLAVVRSMASRVAVMKDGRIVEQGLTKTVFSTPSDPYTARLVGAALPL